MALKAYFPATSVGVTKWAMVASFIIAFVAYLPFGGSSSYTSATDGTMIEDNSVLQILWLSFPSSAGMNDMISYLAAVVGPIAVGIVLLCLVRIVYLLAGTREISGRFGIILSVSGACSLILSGVLEAFRKVNSENIIIDSSSLVAEFIGISVFTFGVLMIIKNLRVPKPMDKRIGLCSVAVGAVFISSFTIYFVTSLIFSITENYGMRILDGVGVVGFVMVMFGIVSVANGIASSLAKNGILLRTSMMAALSIMFIGASYTFLQFGPYVGVLYGGPLEWGTFSVLLSYLYFLGSLMVLGTIVVLGIRLIDKKAREKKSAAD